MYYPTQVPSVLDDDFKQYVNYKEEIVEELKDFLICIWTMQPKTNVDVIVKDIVLIDGCTELVISYSTKQVVFAGPSLTKTAYAETTDVKSSYIGAKFKPGAFTQLTDREAQTVDGRYLFLSEVDGSFNQSSLAGLTFEGTKEFLINYLIKFANGKKPNGFVTLFDELIKNPPLKVELLYDKFHLSPRQCQRQFIKYYGLSPQLVLQVVRFHYCLILITHGKVAPKNILDEVQFSDQSHFIREFKKHLGLTPSQYFKKLQIEIKMLQEGKDMITR